MMVEPMTPTRALALVLSAQHRTPDVAVERPYLIGAADIERQLKTLGYVICPDGEPDA